MNIRGNQCSAFVEFINSFAFDIILQFKLLLAKIHCSSFDKKLKSTDDIIAQMEMQAQYDDEEKMFNGLA